MRIRHLALPGVECRLGSEERCDDLFARRWTLPHCDVRIGVRRGTASVANRVVTQGVIGKVAAVSAAAGNSPNIIGRASRPLVLRSAATVVGLKPTTARLSASEVSTALVDLQRFCGRTSFHPAAAIQGVLP